MEELTSEGWKLEGDAVEKLGATHVRPILLDTDLKQFGAPCLPVVDNKKSGRLVLQVASVDNIGESRKSDRGKRMLRLKLTDGHSTVTAVEYKPVTFLSQDVAPGTKVLVTNARVQSGILLLDERCIQVLGGRVSVLYEAWEIQRKYSAAARTTACHRPPVFGEVSVSKTVEAPCSSSASKTVAAPTKVTRVTLESNPEAGPAQNQAAARKLLDKKADNSPRPRRRRQERENQSVVTLDEWEAQRSGSRPVESDEEFARKLQEKLNLENEGADQVGEAEKIRLSMFSFSREEPNVVVRGQGRGRGRGRRR